MNRRDLHLVLRQAIKEKGLTEWSSLRIVCPVCGGGSTHERSMSIAQTDRGIWYNCFRDKCSARGYLEGTIESDLSLMTQQSSVPQKKKFVPNLRNATDEELQHVPVPDAASGIQWEIDRQMIMYPVLSYYGDLLGHVQRYYPAHNSWWSGPKAVNCAVDEDSPIPFIHFPVLTSSADCASLVLVEDWPSAEAVSRVRPCAALLGTALSMSDVGYLLKIGVKNLTIALDEDATAKAALLKRKYSLVFDDVHVLFLDKDPKDMSKEEIEYVFN